MSTWPVATALGSDVDFDEHRYSDSNVTVGSNISRRVSELLHFKLEFTNDEWKLLRVSKCHSAFARSFEKRLFTAPGMDLNSTSPK